MNEKIQQHMDALKERGTDMLKNLEAIHGTQVAALVSHFLTHERLVASVGVIGMQAMKDQETPGTGVLLKTQVNCMQQLTESAFDSMVFGLGSIGIKEESRHEILKIAGVLAKEQFTTMLNSLDAMKEGGAQ